MMANQTLADNTFGSHEQEILFQSIGPIDKINLTLGKALVRRICRTIQFFTLI